MNESVSAVVPRKRMVIAERGGAPIEIAVRPFRIFGDMQALHDIMPRLQPFLGGIASGDFIGALAEAGEPCLQLIMLATRLDADTIVELESADQLALIAATFEVNVDFFARQLGPTLLSVVNQLVPTIPTGPGEAPSFQDMTANPMTVDKTATETPGPTPQVA